MPKVNGQMVSSSGKAVEQSPPHDRTPLLGAGPCSDKPMVVSAINALFLVAIVTISLCIIAFVGSARMSSASTLPVPHAVPSQSPSIIDGKHASKGPNVASAPMSSTSTLRGTHAEPSHWPLVIDGKDASKGPNAYSDHGFDSVYDALPYVLADKRSPTLQVLLDIHDRCCPYSFRSNAIPMGDFMPQCFQSMDCAARNAAIAGVPEELLVIKWDAATGRCPIDIHLRSFANTTQVRNELEILTERYEHSLKSLSPRDAMAVQGPLPHDHPVLQVLSTFIRSIAWLHAFGDYNGRFRTLVLQHEIRRLGLGPGAFLYNNNRDIFFESSATYSAKIVEGVELAKKHWDSGVNPWLDTAVVKAHLTRFKPAGQIAGGADGRMAEKCHEGGVWGSIL